jgi:hypothetical protein
MYGAERKTFCQELGPMGKSSFADLDPHPVGSALFWRIRIGIQGLPIRTRNRIRIHFNQM